MTLSAFAQQWGLSRESPLLRQALTHRSAAPRAASNERLEFLGDALLGLYIARVLMEALPDADEGILTLARSHIVDRETQADVAHALGLPELLRVDPGGQKAGLPHQTRPLSDAFEAIVAALYLECGEEASFTFVQTALAEPIAAALRDPAIKHPKTRIQEALQGKGQRKPEYRVAASSDTTVLVEILGEQNQILGRGSGRSQRAAERAAAEVALKGLTDPDTSAKL